MVIIPKEKPVMENLNSYYLDIRKLLEHYQGELGSGGVHFWSPSSEAVVFFDKDELLGSLFEDKDGTQQGEDAIKRLLEETDNSNFTVNIYNIAADRVFFWSNLFEAEDVHKDLSTEFTDLEGLAKKMSSEKLTGYIDVSIGNGSEGGLIFFINGEITGGSYSWGKGELNRTKESHELLVQKTKESGGVFQVRRIPSPKGQALNGSEPESGKPLPPILNMLEGLLIIVERLIVSDKKVKTDFSTLLRGKFVEKAEVYSFLDPFANEFKYAEQKITFSGEAEDVFIAKGVTESVMELADELGILPELKEELASWAKKYEASLAKFGISL
jgi:hypothetical protein